ncbi:MAG: FixH family protein [Candidatus Sulfobium sp.]
MRKFAVVCAALLLLAAGVAYANDYSAGKKVGPYDVILKIDHTPAVVGVNKVTFDIRKDTSPVNNLDPELYYFMPAMPAMNYTAHAIRKGDVYSASIKPTMPGQWTLRVKIKGPDGKVHTGTFEFRAK